MIEGHDLEIFERSLEAATSANDGAGLDAALAELGWTEALEDDPRAAVSLFFELQGAANVTSSALDRSIAWALGHIGATVVLPAIGRSDPPGTLVGKHVRVHGVTAGVPVGHTRAVVVAGQGATNVAYEVEIASLQRRAVEGMDPSLGLVEIDLRNREVGAAAEEPAAAGPSCERPLT